MISIDVFDTALFGKLFKRGDILKSINDKDFFIKRTKAEETLSNKVPYYTLHDIYKKLPSYNINEEIEAEKSNIKANPVILKIYNGSPNKFVFIEDTYLSSSVIKSMLESAGYKNPKVFTSSELKANKRSGELYIKVEELINEKITMHYGDDYELDIEGAKKANIKPVFNPALRDTCFPNIEVEDSFLKNYVAWSFTKGKEEYSDLNVMVPIAKLLVPVLLYFVKWVLKKRSSIDTPILFLSKEMKLPYVIATEVFKASNVSFLPIDKGVIVNSKVPVRKSNERIKPLGIDGGIIVDVSSENSANYIAKELFNVGTRNLYMFSDTNGCYPTDFVKYIELLKLLLSSEEDSIKCFKTNEVSFNEDSGKRKYWARITRINVMKVLEDTDIINHEFNCNDLKNILNFLQSDCPYDYLKLYNEPLIGEESNKKSIINYSREGIKIGMLRELYNNSMAKELFIRMLCNDSELCGLSKYLT